MRAALLVFAVGFLAQSTAFRMHYGAPSSKVCQVSEKILSGDALHDNSHLYHISFSLDMESAGGCNSITNCNFFNMGKLAKIFVDKPVRSPLKGRIGKCRCNVKPLKEGESRTLKALPGHDTSKRLLDFISTDREPCDEHWCWLKYNQFVYLSSDPNSSYRNEASSANHWNISCGEGAPTLGELKSIKELQDAAPEAKRLEMVKQAAHAGILPEPPIAESEPEPPIAESESFTHDQDLGGFEDVLNGQPEPDEEDDIPELPERQISYGSMDLAGLRHLALGAVREAEETPGEETLGEETQGEDKDSIKAMVGTESEIPTKERLSEAADLMVMLEGKLAKMLLESETFTQLTHLMNRGKVAEAMDGDWEICKALEANMAVLVRLLNTNVDNLKVFDAATQINNVESEVLEVFLLDMKRAIDLQFSVASDLTLLVEGSREALIAFKNHDGKGADEKANHIMTELGRLKYAVQESRVGLEGALAQILA